MKFTIYTNSSLKPCKVEIDATKPINHSAYGSAPSYSHNMRNFNVDTLPKVKRHRRHAATFRRSQLSNDLDNCQPTCSSNSSASQSDGCAEPRVATRKAPCRHSEFDNILNSIMESNYDNLLNINSQANGGIQSTLNQTSYLTKELAMQLSQEIDRELEMDEMLVQEDERLMNSYQKTNGMARSNGIIQCMLEGNSITNARVQ